MNKEISRKKYYIKNNGVVTEVTEEKYKEFKTKMEKLQKQHLCQYCKICTCDRLFYNDVNYCEEVKSAIYKSKY